MKTWWDTQPLIALFGLPLAILSIDYALVIFFQPSYKPDIHDAPWDETPRHLALIYWLFNGISTTFIPELFFIQQFFTGGNSDLVDL